MPGHKAIPAATAIPNMPNRSSEVIAQAMVRLPFSQGVDGSTIGAAGQCGRTACRTASRRKPAGERFTRPFADPHTKPPGATVTATEALRTCREILDGHFDDLPVDAFSFSGDIGEISWNVGRAQPFSRSFKFWPLPLVATAPIAQSGAGLLLV